MIKSSFRDCDGGYTKSSSCCSWQSVLYWHGEVSGCMAHSTTDNGCIWTCWKKKMIPDSLPLILLHVAMHVHETSKSTVGTSTLYCCYDCCTWMIFVLCLQQYEY